METTKLAKMIPLVFVSTLLCFGQSSSTPASLISKFAGTWKENEAKAKHGSATPLRFRRSADGGLEELHGSDAAPLIEPIHFDGKPYDANSGKLKQAWKQTGKNKFEEQVFDGGQVSWTTRFQISNDGKTLTVETDRKLQDGKTRLAMTAYSRSSGEGPELTGLAGIWKVVSFHSNNPAQVVVSVAGPNSLKVAGQNSTYTAALDNKPVQPVGSTVILGSMIALKQVDDHTITTTASRDGVVTNTSTWTISPDGKVWTVTTTSAGPNASKEPTVIVYEKQ